MELQQYLRILQDYWRSTLATLFLCVALAAGFTLLVTPTYTASSSVFLTVESGSSAGELSQGATYAERQVRSYVSVATTAKVLQPVIDDLQLDMMPSELAERVSVESPSATQIINVSVTDETPRMAALLADAVSQSLINTVDELSPPGPGGVRLVSATIIDQALVPNSPSSPRPIVNLGLGAFAGLVLGIGQAVLRNLLDTRVRSAADIEALTDAPVLASIGHVDTNPERATEATGAQWASGEAYRRLRTNVGFVGLGGERRSSMVMTSSVAGEGKTETIVNLARVLAAAGESVLLVDADLRRPQVAERMRLDSELGLSDVLTGRGSLPDLTIEVISGFLAVLPAGTVPPNPSELLGSEAMAHFIATVERQYDYILFDAPPLLPVTDAVVLGAQVGGAILVSRAEQVGRPQVEAALEVLETGDVTLLGVVLNDVPSFKDGRYGGYYSQYASTVALAK